MFRLAVGDLDSPSYFVATAAVELGFFKQEGIDVELERAYAAHNGAQRLRDGTLDFYGVAAYDAARVFPNWKGAKLLCALSQNSYWFLAVRADLDVKRGDLAALKGLRISTSMAAPVLGLKHLLRNLESICTVTTSGLWRPLLRARDAGGGTPASKPSSRVSPTPIGAMASGSRSARNTVSPSSISICAAAMVRRERAGTTSPL